MPRTSGYSRKLRLNRQQKRYESGNRKAARMREASEEHLKWILKVLKEARGQDGELLFLQAGSYLINSYEDCQGKDVWVTRKIGGKVMQREFGTTISCKSWEKSKRMHRDVPQFCFPLDVKKETVIQRVSELFTDAPALAQ